MHDFIRSINSNPALTVAAKVRLALQKWDELFVYNEDDALHEQVEGNSVQEVAARMFHTRSGICNISATAFALLLRAIKVPTRVYGGYWEQGEGHGGTHLWPAFWDNKRWVSVESLEGVQTASATPRRPMKDIEISGADSEYETSPKRVPGIRKVAYAAIIALLGSLAASEYGPSVSAKIREMGLFSPNGANSESVKDPLKCECPDR